VRITAKKLRELIEYSAETGEFHSLVNRGPIKTGQSVGCVNKAGYVQIQIGGVIYYGHRLAWLHIHGEWPKHCIDHINGIRADNRIENLRDVPDLVNKQNVRRPYSNNRSGHLGVSLHSEGKWQARIKVGSTYKSLGLYLTREAAADAYLSAKRTNHEGCTI
jgi:hypothetical protein